MSFLTILHLYSVQVLLYFTDTVYPGWCRLSTMCRSCALRFSNSYVFYTISQKPHRKIFRLALTICTRVSIELNAYIIIELPYIGAKSKYLIQ